MPTVSLLAAPGPVPNIRGNTPNIVDRLVIKIGLNLIVAASIIATSNLQRDDKILNIKGTKVNFFRGSENNVLKRYIEAAEKFKLDHIVRITADCPFSDPNLIDKMAKKYLKFKYDYVSNVNPPSFPNGFDIEIFSLKLAKKSLEVFKNKKNKEHVTYAIRDKKMSKILKVKSFNFLCDINLNHNRLTLDNIDDYKVLKKLANKININDKWKKIYLKYKDI